MNQETTHLKHYLDKAHGLILRTATITPRMPRTTQRALAG
jgi:hypothetical protein